MLSGGALWVCCAALVAASTSSHLQAGAKRWHEMQIKAEHSVCMRESARALHAGCGALDEQSRRLFALALLDCHLRENGRNGTRVCDECAGSLSDHLFALFTAFYLDIGAICHYISVDLHHERSLLTLTMLHDASALAAERLAMLANSTERLQTSLRVVDAFNERVERWSSGSLVAWLAALLAVFVVSGLSTSVGAARTPCTALVVAAACVEARVSLSEPQLWAVRAAAAVLVVGVLLAVRLLSVSAAEQQERLWAARIDRVLTRFDDGKRRPSSNSAPLVVVGPAYERVVADVEQKGQHI